jgi:hypothetical protein
MVAGDWLLVADESFGFSSNQQPITSNLFEFSL